MSTRLPYDVVIATRNRPDALKVAVQSINAQDPAPERVIVVDSSDDEAAVRRALEQAGGGTYMRSAPGSATQRNVGLREVRSPVACFPDDDVVWHPGYADAILAVYERDTDGVIAAVCGREVTAGPAGVTAPHAMRLSHRIQRKIAYRRMAIEPADPFRLHARERTAQYEQPSWLAEMDAVPVEWMTGFRMSFRTDRFDGFDQTLRDYALFEDVDASFQALERGLVVGANRAHVLHHRDPADRGAPNALGAAQILNRAYIVLKHARPDSPAVKQLRRYAAYKCLLYAAGIRSEWGRARLTGAIVAATLIGQLEHPGRGGLASAYFVALSQCVQTPV
jgi:glycosyltransferase involved in cell wall biosynthesis